MNEHQDFPPEDQWGERFERVDGIPDDVPAPNDAFREALFAETAARVGAHGARRRVYQCAAALAIFATGWLLGARAPLDEPAPSLPSVGERPLSTPPSARPTVPADPTQLDRELASAPAAVRREELMRAGDEYLTGDRLDPSSALHCYRQVLDEQTTGDTSDGSLEYSSDDSWLLKALKVARN